MVQKFVFMPFGRGANAISHTNPWLEWKQKVKDGVDLPTLLSGYIGFILL